MAKQKYGYISNKERDKRVRQSNQSYGLRKLFIILTVAALVVLLVLAIVMFVNYANVVASYADSESGVPVEAPVQKLIWDLAHAGMSLLSVSGESYESFVVSGLSGFGVFLIIWVIITLGLSVVSLVLVLTMISPKAAKANINRLQSAAISGKKIDPDENASKIYRERAMNTTKRKNQEK